MNGGRIVTPAVRGLAASRTRVSILVALLVFTSSLVVVSWLSPVAGAATLYVGGSGLGNFTTIREAVAAASPGDTIYVFSGTYVESVDVDKTLSFVGENRDATVVVGQLFFYPSAKWSNVTRLTFDGRGAFSGVRTWGADNITVTNSVVRDYTYGIYINRSRGMTIRGNVLIGTGIYILGSYSERTEFWNTHTIDTSNTVNGKPVYYWRDRVGGIVPPGAGQIILANVTGVMVNGQDIARATEGIEVGFSVDVTIARNALSQNAADGVGIFYSSGIRIRENSISSNAKGVYLWSAPGTEVSNNTVANSTSTGIHVVASTSARISGNLVSDNVGSGIQFDTTSNDGLASNNNVSGSVFGIYSTFSSDRITAVDNTVSGNMHGIFLTGRGDTILENVAFANTVNGIEAGPNSVVARNTVFDNPEGIRLYSTTGTTVIENRVYGNRAGIILGSLTSSNTVVNNTVSNNDRGIVIGVLSTGDSIVRNNITSNVFEGISVNRSSGIVVTDNVLTRNGLGILLYRSAGSRVFHNNIVDNTQQAGDVFGGGNLWDDGFPSGGNYWSDYGGVDNCTGLAQNECPNPDGIGDTPHSFPGGQDRYPLMSRSVPAPMPPAEPWNLRATAGNGQVTLTWSEPFDDGGTPVTNYRIYRGIASGSETFLVEVGNVQSHTDAGLTNGQTYYYQVSAVNAAGEGARSARIASTPMEQANQPPTCSVLTPAPDDTASGTYPITGTCSDPDGTVQRVEVRIDNGGWVHATGTDLWRYDWDTRAVPNGRHTVSARAFDGTDYSLEVSVAVTVDNAASPSRSIFGEAWFWGLGGGVFLVSALLLIALWRSRGRRPRGE